MRTAEGSEEVNESS